MAGLDRMIVAESRRTRDDQLRGSGDDRDDIVAFFLLSLILRLSNKQIVPMTVTSRISQARGVSPAEVCRLLDCAALIPPMTDSLTAVFC